MNRLAVFTLIILLVAALPACGGAPTPTASPTPADLPTAAADVVPLPTATPVPITLPDGWTDAAAVMAGLCFESVWDAAGSGAVFILRTPQALTELYDLADNSGLCRHPVTRGTFDFSSGQVLIGTWSRGRGCSAHHDLVEIRRDDTARIYAVTVRAVFTGGCAYDLVRPFWIGLDGVAEYDVRLIVINGRAEP